jgi:hypothetical protein
MILSILFACVAPLQPDFIDDMNDRGGCNDILLFAHSDDLSVGLAFFANDQQAGVAIRSGEASSVTADFSDSSQLHILEAQQGVDVGEEWCNDHASGDQENHVSWHAIDGTAVVDVVPDDVGGATATVTLTGVILRSDRHHDDTVQIDGALWQDVVVGQDVE